MINEYEVILGSTGATVKVNTIDLFDSDNKLTEAVNSKPAKKIKTKEEQVVTAQKENIIARAFKMMPRKEEVKEVLPSKPELEEVKIVEEPLIENIITGLPEVEKEPVIEKIEPIIPEVAKEEFKYTFDAPTIIEEKISEPEKVEKPEEKPIYSAPQPTNEFRDSYDKFYNNRDPYEKLKKDSETSEGVTKEVLENGIPKIDAYDEQIKVQNDHIKGIDEQIRELEEEKKKINNDIKQINDNRTNDITVLLNAVKQANQVDAQDKAVAVAKEKAEEELKAKQKQIDDTEEANREKRIAMINNIPKELLQAENAKKPTNVVNIFDKVRATEDTISEDTYSFRRAV